MNAPDYSTITRLKDMQIPEGWGDWITQRSTETNAFFNSGVITQIPNFANQLSQSGNLVNIPLLKPLEKVDPQVPSEDDTIKLNKFSTGLMQARKLGFDQAWSETDLASELSGKDPLNDSGQLIADYWDTFYESLMLKMLDGVFSADSMKGVNQLDATDGRNKLDGTFSLINFNDARFKLGDFYKQLALVVVHSNVLKQLQNANVVDQKSGQSNVYVLNGNQNVPTAITAPDAGDSIKGVQIVVDDSLPNKDGKYTSYLFARGAFGWSDLPADHAVEVGRESLVSHGLDYLVNRRRMVLAPQGISWNESAFLASHTDGKYQFPTLDDISNGANYLKVADSKRIPFVKFTTSDEAIKQGTTTSISMSTGTDPKANGGSAKPATPDNKQ